MHGFNAETCCYCETEAMCAGSGWWHYGGGILENVTTKALPDVIVIFAGIFFQCILNSWRSGSCFFHGWSLRRGCHPATVSRFTAQRKLYLQIYSLTSIFLYVFLPRCCAKRTSPRLLPFYPLLSPRHAARLFPGHCSIRCASLCPETQQFLVGASFRSSGHSVIRCVLLQWLRAFRLVAPSRARLPVDFHFMRRVGCKLEYNHWNASVCAQFQCKRDERQV